VPYPLPLCAGFTPSKIRALTDKGLGAGPPPGEIPMSGAPEATWHNEDAFSIDLDASTAPEDAFNIKLATKDPKSMGLAAGGKLGTSLFSQLFFGRLTTKYYTRVLFSQGTLTLLQSRTSTGIQTLLTHGIRSSPD
jgi:hypothetical protein